MTEKFEKNDSAEKALCLSFVAAGALRGDWNAKILT
jgi:hypothetical protein